VFRDIGLTQNPIVNSSGTSVKSGYPCTANPFPVFENLRW